MKTNKFVIVEHKENYSDMKDFFVGVTVDENGKEGLIAAVYKQDEGFAIANPMIGGTPKDIKKILDSANEIAKNIGRKVRIIRFSSRTIVKEISP